MNGYLLSFMPGRVFSPKTHFEEPKGYWIADGEARPDQKVVRLFVQANPSSNIDREALAEEVAFSPACQL